MKCLAAVVFVFLAGVLEAVAAQSTCPPGTPIANCFADPCSTVKCADGTTCVSNYCGGCNAKCVPNTGCTKANPPVYCLVDPCSVAKCSAGTKCVADYCGGCNSRCEPDSGCTYHGTSYNAGDSFTAVDSCNTCSCQTGGAIACTKIYCPKCYYNSISYNPGDSFPSTDGCNTCTCSDTGTVGCTEKACICPADKPYTDCPYNPCIAALCVQGTTCIADQCGGCFAKCVGNDPPRTCTYNGKTYNSGANFPSTDGCNTCSCNNGNVICTLKACGQQCPLYKCKACTTGHVYDSNGCKTCQCNDPSCEGVKCKNGYFCSDAYCCPDYVKTVRCADPCSDKYCGWFAYCKRYCNCFAKCEWYPWLLW